MAVRVDSSSLADRYTTEERESLLFSFESLNRLRFFEFLASQNDKAILAGFDSEDPVTLANKIIEIRKENNQLLSLSEIPTIIAGADDNA